MTFWSKRLGLVCILMMLSPITIAQSKLKVVTTTGMIADLVNHIGGEQVDVIALMGTGVDPHLYKATQGDVSKLLQADLIVYNGLHLEGRMQDIFTKLAKKKTIHAVTSNIPPEQLLTSQDYQGQADPHIWFDVQLWNQAAKSVSYVLIQAMPNAQAEIDQNYQSYSQTLQNLDQWVKSEIKRIPPEQRLLVTAHDAFGYFARAYDIEVRALQGINTASEFGLHDLKQIRQVILARQVKAIFMESSVPQKFIQSLQAGLKAKGYSVAIGGELFSDAMGLAGTAEGTYVGMVKHNVNTIVEALR